MKAPYIEGLNHIVIITNKSLGSVTQYTSLLQQKIYQNACCVSFHSYLFHSKLHKNIHINIEYKIQNCCALRFIVRR
jgi:hypothetical protein